MHCSSSGWLYDALGSYDVAFHVAGVPIIIGALILLFIPWAQRTSTSTNVMTAARSNYAYMDQGTTGAEEEGDQREVEIAIPLNLFSISSDHSVLPSDEEVIKVFPFSQHNCYHYCRTLQHNSPIKKCFNFHV